MTQVSPGDIPPIRRISPGYCWHYVLVTRLNLDYLNFQATYQLHNRIVRPLKGLTNQQVGKQSCKYLRGGYLSVYVSYVIRAAEWKSTGEPE